MAVPLIIGIAAAIGIGLPVGWKLDRWLFGEEIESLPRKEEIDEFYALQVNLLSYSLSSSFTDKKIYAYYLYLLIVSQQQTLMKLLAQLDSNNYIDYVKNTLKEWEKAIIDIRIEVNATLLRFQCYETLLKKIYNIPFYERDFDVIREHFIIYKDLSEMQHTQLVTWIINPMFNGFFDFEFKELPIISCKIGEIQVKDALNDCKKYLLSAFPLPATKKIDNHNATTADVIMPSILEKYIIFQKMLGKNLMDEWFGFIDAGFSKFTGYNADYTTKGGKIVDDLAGTGADFYNNMKKEFRSFRNSLGAAYSNTAAGLSGFAEAITIAGIGAAALLAYNILYSPSTTNNNTQRY